MIRWAVTLLLVFCSMWWLVTAMADYRRLAKIRDNPLWTEDNLP
jgi:hypothetical protein